MFFCIRAGRFLMGSNDGADNGRPVHEVGIARPFYMGSCPVTQAEYELVTGANPSHFKGANRPVEKVSWDHAEEFCRKLSELEGRPYSLPSEAEWECACRAGSTCEFCFGDDKARLGDYAFSRCAPEYRGCSHAQSHAASSPVASCFRRHEGGSSPRAFLRSIRGRAKPPQV